MISTELNASSANAWNEPHRDRRQSRTDQGVDYGEARPSQHQARQLRAGGGQRANGGLVQTLKTRRKHAANTTMVSERRGQKSERPPSGERKGWRTQAIDNVTCRQQATHRSETHTARDMQTRKSAPGAQQKAESEVQSDTSKEPTSSASRHEASRQRALDGERCSCAANRGDAPTKDLPQQKRNKILHSWIRIWIRITQHSRQEQSPNKRTNGVRCHKEAT